MSVKIEIEEEDRQMILSALADKSRKAPGFADFLGRIADKIPGGRQMFEDFRTLNAEPFSLAQDQYARRLTALAQKYKSLPALLCFLTLWVQGEASQPDTLMGLVELLTDYLIRTNPNHTWACELSNARNVLLVGESVKNPPTPDLQAFLEMLGLFPPPAKKVTP